ncbi:MAG TPA: hypothetical protein VLX92_28790 [Kofleriaceae bacterium]|nr:hypothetical protein [Kofleriaceae bacterium]
MSVLNALPLAVIACSSAQAPAPAAPGGAVRWPPIVDSHVHLVYAGAGIADQLAAHGVLAVVDLAEPERALGAPEPIAEIAAGPMLTHRGGYPLDAWGQDGYGVGCDDAACVARTIDRLAGEGAGVIKVALDDDGLDPLLLPVAVAAAHAHHLKVAVHALSDASAARAAAAGVDILAHTPVEPLAPATVAAWRGRAVISTLAAFGARPSAIANLRALRAAGVTVLYGTDLGNLQVDGPSPDEVDALRKAGLDDAAITAAMTTTPIAFWKLDLAGSYLELDRDPTRDAGALLHPRSVHGRARVR